MRFAVDYAPAKECQNANAYYICVKCGKCGRLFDCGVLVNDGGTHVMEYEEAPIAYCETNEGEYMEVYGE